MSKGWDAARKGSTTRWRKLRAQVLDRDNHLCQIRGRRCTDVGTEVDHIQPIAMGGEMWDPGNLRASCKPCNLDRRYVAEIIEPTTHSRW